MKLHKLGFVLLIGTMVLTAQVEPQAGTWRTLVIDSGSALRLPPAEDAAATAAEIQQLKALVAQPDPIVAAQVRYWDAGAPGYRWMVLAYQEVVKRNLAAPYATRALAMVSVAIYDATIAAWDSKYTYNRPRPSDVDPTVLLQVAKPNNPPYPPEHPVTAGPA